MKEITSEEVRQLAEKILAEKYGLMGERVTRSILARLSKQYVEIKHVRRVGPGVTLWSSEMPGQVASIIVRELQTRGAGAR